MGNTFLNLKYHIIFGTRERRPWITSELAPELFKYFGGIVQGEGGALHDAGGYRDHVHLLIGWRADEALSALIRRIKSNSTHWIHKTFPDLSSCSWQDGYAAFTVSQSQLERVSFYIQRQEEHHHGKTFTEEYKEFLQTNGIAFDEKYLLDWFARTRERDPDPPGREDLEVIGPGDSASLHPRLPNSAPPGRERCWVL